MDAFQAVAVDQEVLRTCDERAHAITGLMAAQRDGEAQLAKLLGTHVETTSTAPAPDAPGIAARQFEVEILCARVETLEAQPGGSPGLPAARAALADAEARLEAAERDVAADSQTVSPVGTGQDYSSQDEPTDGEVNPLTTGMPGAVPSDTASDTGSGNSGSPDNNGVAEPPSGDETPNLAELLPGMVDSADGATTLPEEVLGWTLVYTVRGGDGPWRAQVLGEGRRAVLLPALTEDSEPRLEWQAFLQGLFLLVEGNPLPGDPDGRVVTEITRDGAMIRSEQSVAEASVPLTWHQGGDPHGPNRLKGTKAAIGFLIPY